MKDLTAHVYAAPEELRTGMDVHLEGGWLAHPFPLSNFKIVSPEQVATLRSLGLTKIRWSPEKSDPVSRASGPDSVDAGAEADCHEAEQGTSLPQGNPAQSFEASEQEQRLCILATQREAACSCEKQYAEAAKEYEDLSGLLRTNPQLARKRSESLAHALVSKMLRQGEFCVSLLSEAAGSRAASHAVNVAVVSLLLGKALGLSESEMLDLGAGAILHDIGKLDLPKRAWYSEGQLSAPEQKHYEQHVMLGLEYAKKMGLSPGASLILAQHHECVDGGGFPDHLSSDRLSMGSRIVALIDRYDNLCNPKVNSMGLTPHEAMAHLFAQGKAKFDTTILNCYIKMIGVYPPGSVVQLTDSHYALVVSVNANRPLKPSVLAHDPDIPRDEALVLNLQEEDRLGILRGLKPTQIPRESFEYLSPCSQVTYFFEPARLGDAVAVSPDFQ